MLKILTVTALLAATLFLGVVFTARAQVAPNQNQILLPGYWGGGFLISTSSAASTKLGTSLVDLAGSWVSGILPISRGGTGTSTAPADGQLLIGNAGGTWDYIASSTLAVLTNYWTKSGTDLYYTGGNVGIGTTSPSTPLNVSASTSDGVRIDYTAGVGSSALPFQIVNDSGLAVMSIGANKTATEGILNLRAPTGQGSGTGINFFSDVGGTTKTGLFQMDGAGNMVFRQSNGSMFYDFVGGVNFRNSSFVNVVRVGASGAAVGRAVNVGSATFTVHDATASTGQTQLLVQGGATAGDATSNQLFRINQGGGTTGVFVVQGDGKVGIGTTAPTNALTFPAGSSGIAMYLGADQTVNYERAIIDYSSGPRFLSQAAGTGIARNLTIGQASGSTQLLFSNSFGAQFNGSSASASFRALAITNTLSTAVFSTDAVAALDIRPTISQTGTAAYAALRVQPTINTTGSGTSYLAQIGTSTAPSLFTITPTGNVGIGTTTPGSIFSINNVANFTTATSTLYGSGGINITSGCYAINGVCIGGGSSSYTFTYPLVDTASTISLAFGTTTSNTWAGTQTFGSILATAATSTDVGVTNIRAISSAGIDLIANSGTPIALFGAGGGANATFYGGVNINGLATLANASSTAWSSSYASSTNAFFGNLNVVGTATSTFAGGIQAVTGFFSGLVEFTGNILLAASSYINFGTLSGSTGYGFRDLAGVIQFKNSGGDWANVASAPAADQYWQYDGEVNLASSTSVTYNIVNTNKRFYKMVGYFVNDSSVSNRSVGLRFNGDASSGAYNGSTYATTGEISSYSATSWLLATLTNNTQALVPIEYVFVAPTGGANQTISFTGGAATENATFATPLHGVYSTATTTLTSFTFLGEASPGVTGNVKIYYMEE